MGDWHWRAPTGSGGRGEVGYRCELRSQGNASARRPLELIGPLQRQIVSKNPQGTIFKIEETQRALRNSIEETKKLAKQAQRLVERHRKERPSPLEAAGGPGQFFATDGERSLLDHVCHGMSEGEKRTES